MRSLEEFSEKSPDVHVEAADGDAVIEVFLSAAAESGVDLENQPHLLNEVVDGDALNRIFHESDSEHPETDCSVVVDVWNRSFVVRSEAVEVYR